MSQIAVDIMSHPRSWSNQRALEASHRRVDHAQGGWKGGSALVGGSPGAWTGLVGLDRGRAGVFEEIRKGAEDFGGLGVAVRPAPGLSGDLAKDDADLVAIFEPGFAKELDELFGRREELLTAVILDLEVKGALDLVGA
ncbi:MAG TPA: hypothetical protein VK459_06815, partial [Polyangiaceae bacterium]|nr:hypothetical protein [Polyangiaceae bacterium]